jgi:AcrR family transcriptional regulator
LETSVSTSSARPYHHGDLRRALIDSSLEIIATAGARALTLREAARRAGVSHTAPYRHFSRKEALLAAVAEEGFRDLTAAMLERMDKAADDPLRRYQESGIGYVLFAVGHPAHFRVMFGSDLADLAAYPDLQEAGWASYRVLTDAIEACQRAGLVRAVAVQDLALTSWSLVHGLAMLLVDRQLEPWAAEAENLARLVTATLHRGVLATNAETP